MVNAQKATNRVVAVGLNRRGNEVYQRLAKEISAGKIGKISVARAARISNMYPNGIGKLKPEQPPKDLNWDMWIGPVLIVPINIILLPICSGGGVIIQVKWETGVYITWMPSAG